MNSEFRYDTTALEKAWPNSSITENGAVGYKTSQSNLVDINFAVSSFRNQVPENIVREYIKAYYESPMYAIKWLFFLRDIEQGLGERRTFRICMKYLAFSHPVIAESVMKLIPKYGRYDDLLIFLETPLSKNVCRYMKEQLEKDLTAMKNQQPVSLLGKWLPSINTSSDQTRELAKMIAKQWGMSEKKYRKILAALRSYSNVLETKISDSKWEKIDYSQVPAKANLKYEAAFERHDKKGRMQYLYKVLRNNADIHSKGIMPYEPVHRLISKHGCYSAIEDDMLAEIMWKMLQEQGFQNDWGLQDCIVVADGSGSMYSIATGSTSVRAIEISTSLAIYFAEQLSGKFHNKAITFSRNPQFIDLQQGESLKEKLEIMLAHDEIANTNIEAVFELLLKAAVSGNVPKEELPRQVLIISDMEFDQASCSETEYYNYFSECKSSYNAALFDQIEERYKKAGYDMPRLIFWNVCGRTNMIPKLKNEAGITLLSGFSQNAMKIASDREKKDPYQSLIRVLDSPRYQAVEEALVRVPLQSPSKQKMERKSSPGAECSCGVLKKPDA